MQVQEKVYPANKFLFSNTGCVCVADASDLGLRPGVVPYGRMYDDAADAGFTLLNPATGHSTRWYLASEMESEGEVTGWLFSVGEETVRKYPHMAGYGATIYND